MKKILRDMEGMSNTHLPRVQKEMMERMKRQCFKKYGFNLGW